jgi:hypothetical protein
MSFDVLCLKAVHLLPLQDLGHKSVNWTPELFWQLLRSAAATPVSLVQTYYNTYDPFPFNTHASLFCSKG